MARLFKGPPPTDEELDAALASASDAGPTAEPLATSVHFDAASRRVVVELNTGATFIFPVDRVEGLAGQPNEMLATVQVMPGGDGIGWPTLDVHYHVASLVLGTFGGKSWMRQLRGELLKQAASRTSPARARAARENGKKGGRPRKAAP